MNRNSRAIRKCFPAMTVVLLLASSLYSANKTFPQTRGSQWYPCLEWSVENPSHDGNPFDLETKVIFVHRKTGRSVTTSMFYDGGHTWRLRFTGILPGEWSFQTFSDDADLNGWAGTITIEENADPRAHGFIEALGNKWGWQGTEEAFIPQYVMGKDIEVFYDSRQQRVDEALIEREIAEFIDEHGFTGFHVQMRGRWFDLDGKPGRKTNPDLRTYQVIETLIRMVHARGGACHLWMWGKDKGKDSDGPVAILGAAMNDADKRNLRYLAARLGPLPGWSMGYGYDTENLWAPAEQLEAWKDYLASYLGWSHFLGARAGFDENGPYAKAGARRTRPPLNEKFNAPIGDQYTAWLGGDYTGYTSYRPLYDRYVEELEHRPDKPSFEEDRFRIRQVDQWLHKDYNAELTRKGLWHSAMAGGVANIWGHLLPDADQGGSQSYDHGDVHIKHLIKTYAAFFRDKGRFRKDFIRDNGIADPRTGTTEQPEPAEISVCLRDPARTHYIFYKENCSTVGMNLAKMQGPQRAVAVDAKSSYKEIGIGTLSPQKHDWQAPYKSDWAIAVGDY